MQSNTAAFENQPLNFPNLSVENRKGDRFTIADGRYVGHDGAQLSIYEGHAADTETVLRTCEDQFHGEQQADDELTASSVLILALLAEAKYPEAKKELEASVPLAAKSQNLSVGLQFHLSEARVRLLDHPESALLIAEHVLRGALPTVSWASSLKRDWLLPRRK